MANCFCRAEILLPVKGTDFSKWAVIACDQYTSQQDYWTAAENYVGSAPSTLNMIFPEIYLGKDSSRIERIRQSMDKYLEDATVTAAVKNGYVLVERVTQSGTRMGLVGCVDLEQYDFTPAASTLIRATEQTVVSRIPPRVEIRRGAALEMPHVMLLIDDAERKIIEPLFEKRGELRPLYDTELMLRGGHIRGYAIEGAQADALDAVMADFEENCSGLLFAVGDGNHSLATAKACWEELKPGLSESERETHPARFALVELVNLHCEALCFEPIYRLLENTGLDALKAYIDAELASEGMSLCEGREISLTQGERRIDADIANRGDRLPVDIIQNILDKFLKEHTEASIDYIHGVADLEGLVESTGGCGVFFDSFDKTVLFRAIKAGGVLPRKTFSIGEANEKRYYMECRKLN